MMSASRKAEAFALGWALLMVSMPALVQSFAGNNALRYTDFEILSRVTRLPFAIGIILLTWALLGSRLFLWISLPLSVFAQFETFHILVMKTPSSIGTIGSMLDTNPREMHELVSSYVPFVMASIALMICHTIILFKTRRFIQPTTVRARILILCSALSLLIPEFVFLKTRPWEREWKIEVLKLDAQETFPFGTLDKLTDVLQTKYRLTSRTRLNRSFDWKAHRSVIPGERETYVIIIGESSRSGNWGLYGYGKPTTPRLQADSDLIVFKDMTSGATETTESVPMLLTLATPEDIRRFDSTSSILSSFRQMGFKTWWLSTQGRFGAWDVKPSMIGKEAHEWSFLNIDPDDETLHDGALLPLLDTALRDTATRKLIVLHTSGSHFQYTKRYPEPFAKFAVTDEEEYEFGSYDNSILYTDWVLDQVLSRIRNVPGIRSMAYISDHGEALGENDCYNHSNDEPPRAEFEVPFFVWVSDELKQLRPEVASQLRSHVDAKASASDFLPTILDITGVRTPLVDSTRSLAGKSYRPRVRTVRLPQGNLVDVDQLTGSSFSSPLASGKALQPPQE